MMSLGLPVYCRHQHSYTKVLKVLFSFPRTYPSIDLLLDALPVVLKTKPAFSFIVDEIGVVVPPLPTPVNVFVFYL